MNLHLTFYQGDKEFIHRITNDEKTMYLFTNNADKDKMNGEKLVETSKNQNKPVARLDCWFDTNKLQGGKERQPIKSHFDDHTKYVRHTDICVGARVSIISHNFLPEVGLYNGAIGTVIEIVYKSSPAGPNDKEHRHLPDYVVVDFPHLNLPSHIDPWDTKNPTVSNFVHSWIWWQNVKSHFYIYLSARSNSNENYNMQQACVLHSRILPTRSVLGNNDS